MSAMQFLFWTSFGLAFYAYCGYVLYLWVRARIRTRPIVRAPIFPRVSIILAVRNEGTNLPGKLRSLSCLRYPKDRIQIVCCSDGSTDDTAENLRSQGDTIISVILEDQQGKAHALNEAVQRATGEILFFQDARQPVDPDALAQLVSCFADGSVGAASGELMLTASDGTPSRDGLGVYWRLEKALRKLESATGSVVGVTGAIYAIRRELYTPMPDGTILDDVFIPMHVARMGKRVVFEPSAIARDGVFNQRGKEFKRKVRTLTGNYQLLKLAPWMLTPANPLLFRLISHKLLRLVMPFILVVMLATSGLSEGLFYKCVFLVQIAFYALAALGTVFTGFRRFKPAAIAHTFVMLNIAAAVAFCNFVRGKSTVWV